MIKLKLQMKFSKLLLAGLFLSFQISTALAADLDFTVNLTHPSCTGLSDGEISITPVNGVPEYRVYVFGPGDFYSTTLENTDLSAGEYSIRVEDANDDYIVKEVSLNAPVVARISMDDVNTICSDEIVLSANTPDRGFGRWLVISGSGNFSDAYSPNSAVSDIGPGSNIYLWSLYSDACITSDTVEVINNRVPFANAGSDMIICTNTATLSGSMPSNCTGHWSVVSGAGFFQDGENSQPDATVRVDNGVNAFKWTINHQGCESSDTVVVHNAIPHPVNAGPDQNLVGSSETYMSAEPVIQGEGTWSLISGGGTIVDITDPYSRITNLRPGPNVFRWSVVSGYCINYDEVVVTNSELPEAYAGTDLEICTDETTLNAMDPGNAIGSWSIVSGSAVFEDRYDPNTRVSNLSRGENILRWTISYGDYQSHDDVVITNYSPDDASAGDDFKTHESSVALMASTPSIGSGTWSLMSGSGIFDDPENPNTTVRDLLPGENILRWTVINNLCASYDEVVVTYQVATSINSTPVDEQKMTLYPNPASDKLNISTEDQATLITRVEIHSSAGVKVLDALLDDAEEPSIDVSGLKAGHYVVTVHHEDGIRSGHFVKR